MVLVEFVPGEFTEADNIVIIASQGKAETDSHLWSISELADLQQF